MYRMGFVYAKSSLYFHKLRFKIHMFESLLLTLFYQKKSTEVWQETEEEEEEGKKLTNDDVESIGICNKWIAFPIHAYICAPCHFKHCTFSDYAMDFGFDAFVFFYSFLLRCFVFDRSFANSCIETKIVCASAFDLTQFALRNPVFDGFFFQFC